MSGFRERYGPWALVAGASEGIGAAFATALAQRGLEVVLVARRAEPVAALAGRLPVGTITVPADLATAEGLAAVQRATCDLQIGLVIVNAADSPIGPFVDLDPARAQRALDLNCRAPPLLAHWYLPPLAARGRGGMVLAEGLWAELRGSGVDVLACVPRRAAIALIARGSRDLASPPEPATGAPTERPLP